MVLVRTRYLLAFIVGLAYGVIAVPASASPYVLAEPAQEVLKATSDAFPDIYRLSVEIDSDFRAIALRGNVDGKTQRFPIAQLEDGIVLLHDSGRDIILLQGNRFNPGSGGELLLTYLNSGLSNRYRSVRVALERTGANWQMLADDSAGRRVVTDAYFKGNRVLGRIVGIDSVVFRTSSLLSQSR